jgi:protein-glutamine gamma-glutamyltransferase
MAMDDRSPPPRLLLGSALLLWGALTDRSVVGLVLALVVEARHWTGLRWEFDERAQIRAWRLVVLLIFVTLVFLWLDDVPLMAVPRLLGWLPALLLPLQFTQTYGTRGSMSARVFALFPSGRREILPAHHPASGGRRFDFGWVYLVATLVAATPVWKMRDSAIYLPGLVVLACWALIATRRSRWPQVVAVMVVAGALGLGGQWALDRLVGWLNDGMFRGRGLLQDPTHFRTAIGRLGKIKQSSGIIWRLRNVENGEIPRLLRSRAYNRYNAGLWIYAPPMRDGVSISHEEDFSPLDVVALPDGRGFNRLRLLDAAALAGPERSWFGLVGTVEHHAPVPLPDSATGMTGFDVQSFEANSLGTVRIFLKEAVVEGMVAWKGDGNRESDPVPEDDLAVGTLEKLALGQTLAELELDKLPSLQAKLARVQAHFNGFGYTRYNTIEAPNLGGAEGATAISRFLTDTRRGHCEYFATAACLLLREAGIPTRYAIGFVVTEHDKRRNEWVIRGTHAHAWTRVWDARAGLWRDFDPTPPGWEGEELGGFGWLQFLFDFIRRSNEDFNLWRNQPGNTGVVGAVLFGIGSLVLGLIVWRLWHSGARTRGGGRRGRRSTGGGVITPLHRLEKAARKHLPPRPCGRTFADWLGGLETVLPEPAALREAVALHQRLRFDPAPPGAADRERLAALARELEKALKRAR